jgi:hypothetical protein
MDTNIHTSVGQSEPLRFSSADRRGSDPVSSDRYSVGEPALKPTARQIADAIVRFILTGARG